MYGSPSFTKKGNSLRMLHLNLIECPKTKSIKFGSLHSKVFAFLHIPGEWRGDLCECPCVDSNKCVYLYSVTHRMRPVTRAISVYIRAQWRQCMQLWLWWLIRVYVTNNPYLELCTELYVYIGGLQRISQQRIFNSALIIFNQVV